jgi:hypothetical protein
MWWWILIWVLLIVAGGVYLGMRTWGLWGQTRELGSELAAASRRLEEVQGQLELLGERIGAPQELAVFADPLGARRQRDRAKADGRQARQQRRSVSRPAWARDVE